MDCKHMYETPASAQLLAPAQVTASTNTVYFDTNGYWGFLLMVDATGTTADSSNYFAFTLYGYTGDTPGTASNYTAVASTELNGTLANLAATGAYSDEVALLQHKYRYYYLKLNETGTADITAGVRVLLYPRDAPGYDDTVTTGAVT